jgi:hypothetical protein
MEAGRWRSVLALSIAVGSLAISGAAFGNETAAREAFEKHWKSQGDKVVVLEVLPPQGGFVYGSARIDGDLVSEYYNLATGEFTDRRPTTTDVARRDTDTDSDNSKTSSNTKSSSDTKTAPEAQRGTASAPEKQ